ncbi:unnamed protein product [Gongylonema pulchrum]|uniref:Uncharacterized protein n=1 Tax=Gongylonema pulchrum TaxID=637853 RepID=A0A183E9S2_9BILA|nr:unnamed protein product [Gongylonema pulchrum]
MKKCDYYCTLFLIFFDYVISQNPSAGNELDFDDQKVVTLGPPRDGFQRAVFDEVSMNEINRQPVEDITQMRNDIEAYDDKFVDPGEGKFPCCLLSSIKFL